MPIFHCKITNNVKDQANIFSPKLTNPVEEMVDNENYLDELTPRCRT